MGPYAEIDQEAPPSNYYQACSTGPTTCDGDGELVWSGACLVENQNACDFRAFTDYDGNEFLSMIFHGHHDEAKQKGSIIDNEYNLANARNLTPPILESGFNMHEYKIIDQGHSALYITLKTSWIDARRLNIPGIDVGFVANVGFREVNLSTGETARAWWCLGNDRITPAESALEADDGSLTGP